MKKLLMVVLAMVISMTLLITLTSCQNPDEGNEGSTDEPQSTVGTTEPGTETTKPGTETTAPDTETEDPGVETQPTAAKYKVTFKAGDTVVGEVEFTVGDDSVEEPAVPAKEGYTGAWAEYTLGEEDITVEAVYTLKEFKATFKADGVVVGELTFNITTESLDEPAVPAKDGYTGAWAEYTLGLEDITIEAVYTLIEVPLKATFMANGAVVEVVEFKDGDTELSDVPEVPYKPGYKGAWEEYELGNTDIVINAVYTANNQTPNDDFGDEEGVTRTVTFVVDWNDGNGATVYKTVEFKVGDTSIAIPEAPKKSGYRVTWEAFELGTQSIIVNAIVEVDTTTPWA